MAGKVIKYDMKAREAMLNGVKALADAAREAGLKF